jgi:hypothetical protein
MDEGGAEHAPSEWRTVEKLLAPVELGLRSGSRVRHQDVYSSSFSYSLHLLLLVIEEWTMSSTPKVEMGETLIDSYTSEIAGRRTHYLATGVGAPVVLLHSICLIWNNLRALPQCWITFYPFIWPARRRTAPA